MLPADGHVHSEWSWDTGGPLSAAAGTMERTCERAVRIGLPALAFTEHLDFPEPWFSVLGDGLEAFAGEDGRVRVSLLDVDGYLECVERCRHRFPGLRILTGVEFGQPHLHAAEAAALLDSGLIDRVNGSLHTLPHGDGRAEPATLFRLMPPERVIEAYLAEVPAVVAGGRFDVYTHIDYAVRYWPEEEAGPFDPRRFEEGFRAALRTIAASGRPLEMNTRRLQWWVPRWWIEEGGRAVTIASDAHTPDPLAHGFPETALLLESMGFRPGSRPEDPWTR